MPLYTFISRDLLSTAILPDDPNTWMGYNANTTWGVQGPKATQLTPNLFCKHGPPVDATIGWKDETFTIAGTCAKVNDLKWRPKNSKSSRMWRWSHKSFIVTYHTGRKRWTASDSSRRIDVTFTLCKTRLFKADDPALIHFSDNISTEELVFLMVVMIYSEIKRQDRKERASAFRSQSLPLAQ